MSVAGCHTSTVHCGPQLVFAQVTQASDITPANLVAASTGPLAIAASRREPRGATVTRVTVEPPTRAAVWSDVP
jgi:hypothetical protein